MTESTPTPTQELGNPVEINLSCDFHNRLIRIAEFNQVDIPSAAADLLRIIIPQIERDGLFIRHERKNADEQVPPPPPNGEKPNHEDN